MTYTSVEEWQHFCKKQYTGATFQVKYYQDLGMFKWTALDGMDGPTVGWYNTYTMEGHIR